MGKSSARSVKPVSKGKDKKAQRKEELERLRAKESLVTAANAEDDLLAPLAPFRRFDRNGVEAAVSCCTAAQLLEEQQSWAFELCKANMQAFYEGCQEMGWSETKKRAQLTAPEARFLVATGRVDGGEEQPLAYSHFRFEMEGECPVLYCWELQVEGVARRRGLGRFLMQVLELLACRAGMEWVMLTVMNANTDAYGLYTKMGYSLDETSPTACDVLSECGYDILSKKLPPPKDAHAARQPAAAAAQPSTGNGGEEAGSGKQVVGSDMSPGLRTPMAALAVN